MNWYYEKAGQRMGPVPETELDRLIASGEINAATLVWSEGMANWTPLGQARPAASGPTLAPGEVAPPGFIKCTATGKYFPPSEIVYIDGKPYSAAAKPAVLQGVMQSGVVPAGFDTNRDGPAWEQREQLGIPKAGWETIKQVLLKPSEAFQSMKREGGIGGPLMYAVIFGSIGSIAGLAYQFLVNMGTTAIAAQNSPQTPNFNAMFAGMSGGMMLVLAILMPGFIALGSFIGAGILQLSLMICGAAKQPFETTFRTYCYVQGSAGILQVVPVCGSMVSGIWALVCLCIGLSKTQEISVGKAVLAVLLPTIVCCVGIGVVAGAIFGAVMAAQGAGH